MFIKKVFLILLLALKFLCISRSILVLIEKLLDILMKQSYILSMVYGFSLHLPVQ